jgi:signal transduction histidine kinase
MQQLSNITMDTRFTFEKSNFPEVSLVRHAKMKQELDGLSQRYVAGLRKYLKLGSHASLLAASRLGREAVAFGLETLGLARIHERALAVMVPSSRKNGKIERAKFFLILATTPFEETHHAARSNIINLNRLRTPVSRRVVNENPLLQSEKDKSKYLEESLQLQKHLRRLTHRVLAAQEDERKKISCELQDEIAQTLLGINVRLLSLKEKARSNPKGLKKEIASTRRLVVKSAKSLRQFAHELDKRQEK